MIITPAMHQQFQEQGYFILESFFSPEEIAAITTLIDRYAQHYEEELRKTGPQDISRPGEISFKAFLAENDPGIAAFCKQPKMVALVTELIGPNVRLYWNQAVYKQPENPHEFPWHQDNGYTPVEPEQYYTCWLALSDATVENGCVWVLPGTHRQGTLPHADSPIGRVGYTGSDPGIPVPLKSGSMVVFSSLLLHRSGPNLSRETRKAYIIQYIPAHACNGRTGEPFTDRMWVARGGLSILDAA